MKTPSLGCVPVCAAMLVLSSCGGSSAEPAPTPRPRWTEAQADSWYAAQPWLVGANFVPSTAVNQLDMWQADTYDEATIDRELGWAADLGTRFRLRASNPTRPPTFIIPNGFRALARKS